MSATDSTPELSQLGKDHRELRLTMSDLMSQLARVEGKIDTQTALLERVSTRQDRSEAKIEEIEREFRSEIRRLEDKAGSVQKTVWMGVGGITFASFFVTLVISVWKLTSGS